VGGEGGRRRRRRVTGRAETSWVEAPPAEGEIESKADGNFYREEPRDRNMAGLCGKARKSRNRETEKFERERILVKNLPARGKKGPRPSENRAT